MDRNVHVLTDRRLWALAGSLLVHVLFLVLSGRDVFFVFETHPSPAAEERRLAFEIIETPESHRSEVPPEEADMLSDKHSSAADAATDRADPGLQPFSEGLLDVKTVPSEGVGSAVEQRSIASQTRRSVGGRGERGRRQPAEESDFSRDALVGSAMAASAPTRRQTYRQTDSRAPSFGSIRFNTYAWDFAPYLIYLKSQIAKNIYPPPVFTHMGFGGTNVLQFRIDPEGRLVGPRMIEFEGEHALVETSAMAIRVSAPFKSLPDDFPEPFLEVTATFHYIGLSRN